MTLTIDRRQLLAGMAATLAFSSIGLSRANAATAMRLLWWGSKERSDRTFAAVKAYQAKNPDITIAGESFGWDSYWTRLATQTGGGNAPDLIQMDYRYIFEYARRGALLDMTPYFGKSLKIEDFGPANIDSGKVDNKIYGVSLGVNSSMVVVNTAAWDQAGVEPPRDGMTWEQLGDACAKVTAAKKRRGFYGTADASGGEPAFECWLRQRGKALYTADGKLAFEAKDATEWFDFWGHMREIGACTPADVQALDQQTLETDMLVTKKAAVSYAHSNQFVAIQGLVKEKLDLVAYPSNPGSKPGQYLKPSMLMSVSATSQNKDAAIAFVNYLVEDPEGTKALGVERGVPPSKKIRDLLTPDLDATSKQVVDYIGRLTPHVGALPPSPPNGAGENAFLLKKIAEEVAFGKTSAQDAGTKFTEQAAANITRG